MDLTFDFSISSPSSFPDLVPFLSLSPSLRLSLLVKLIHYPLLDLFVAFSLFFFSLSLPSFSARDSVVCESPMNAFDSAMNAMHGTSEKTMSGRLHEEGASSHPKLCVPMPPMSCAPSSLPSPSSVPPSQEVYLKSTSETWTGGVHEPQCGPTDRISMLSSSGASMTSTDSPFGFPDTFALLGVPTDIEDVVREGEMSAWAEVSVLGVCFLSCSPFSCVVVCGKFERDSLGDCVCRDGSDPRWR